ncbi:CDGSH iron-sulfur domain-containing protein [Christensenella intestinihominis]|uniref:CDGSH iron-sulfur domain-containing protein n=1 Tax=Christensenella intestinihominis TaxID=1851429 RepID=UPI00083069C5|nr:CDGSH iron-sulfur domain-containing protein [Christensenella intestinihominis]
MRIKVLKDGPYEVTGNVPLKEMKIGADGAGESTHWVDGREFETEETYHLCRCGNSKNKPFCDGSHMHGFDGTETADNISYDEAAIVYRGDGMDLMDAEGLCAVARFCDAAGSTWRLINDAETGETAVRQACNCPSGRLTAVKDGKKIEPKLPKEIAVVEDEPEGMHGPLWVRGGIEIEAEDGTVYEVRNRVTLCRCGNSANKPFCDAMHMDGGEE